MINPSDTQAQADHRMLPDHYRGCPYFGFPDDADTRVMFPIGNGTCHRAVPTGQVQLSYQQTTCLSPQHQSCPVFLRHHKAPLPPEISGVEIKRSGSRRVLLGVMVILLFSLVGTFVGLWWANSDSDLEALIATNEQDNDSETAPAVTVVPTESATAVLAVAEVKEPTAVVIIEKEPTAEPTETSRPTETAVPPLPATFTPLAVTNTPVATATTLLRPVAVVDVVRLNVRLGPNTAYEAIGLLDEATEVEIVGRVGDETWLQICCVGGQEGWVFTEAVLVDGELEVVPVIVEFPPLPDSDR